MTASSAAQPAIPGSREGTTIAACGAAHFGSHFLQVALAPVLPLMTADFGVGFTELGLIITIFYATSGIGQVAAGVLVDRFGPHRLLLAGITLQSLGILAMGIAPTYWALIPLAVAAGLGNTVYHPADLSILSRRVSPARLGRAFATHSITGSIGFASAPVAVGTMAAMFGWRAGLIGAGLVGLAVAAALFVNRAALVTEMPARGGEAADGMRRVSFLQIIAMPVVLLGFGFFLFSAVSGGVIQSFSISALTLSYGATLTLATIAATLFQVGAIGGVFIGGMLVDRMHRHHIVAMAGCGLAAILILGASLTALPLWAVMALMTAAGVTSGATLPARDVLIRRAAPAGGLGKAFGAVYSGLDAGSLLGPLIAGPMLDHGAPPLIFVVASVTWVGAVLTVMGIGRQRREEG